MLSGEGPDTAADDQASSTAASPGTGKFKAGEVVRFSFEATVRSDDGTYLQLIASNGATLRFAHGDYAATVERLPRPLRVADLELDEASLDVRRAGNLVHLSHTEYRLLHLLMTNPDRALAKREILERVWAPHFDPNIVEAYISLLRQKVDSSDPRLIHTKRGFGYILRVPR